MTGSWQIQAESPELDEFEDKLRDMATDMLNKGHPVELVAEAFAEIDVMLTLYAGGQNAEACPASVH